MQKQILAAIASLTLLSGCGGTDREAAAPGLTTGEKVYKSTCSICHKSGLSSAPRIGNKGDWEARLAQGKDILYEHAIHGYQGSKGFMPARGSGIKLSDDEVKAAVDYMAAQATQNQTVEK